MQQQSTPFYDHMGFKVVERADGRSVVRLPFRRQLGNSHGKVHGGALSSLLDVSMSQALRSCLSPQTRLVTIGMDVHFLAPGDGDLTGHGEVLNLGKTIAVVKASIRDGANHDVAISLGTFRLLSP